MPDAPENLLFICTVGGSPDPIVAALKHWGPARVLFVPTGDTAAQIEGHIVPAAREGTGLGPGAYRTVVVPDGQDLKGAVQAMRDLEGEVADWLRRGEGYGVVADMTGGTKCMSAALALLARRWRCRFSYVGGGRRTKEGVGIVVSGSERVVFTENPWEVLGYQAVEDACLLVIVSRVSRTSDRRIRKTVYDERGADPQQPAADLPGLRRA